jgi:TATA-binding protein-associated factor
LCNVQNASLRQLAKQEDVDDIINLYADYFDTEPTAGWEPIIDTQPKISIPFGVPADDSAVDPGVEMESNMKPEALCHNLGFKNGLPILFNRYRHVDGLIPWDPKFQHLFTDPTKRSPDLKPIALHWHQMAGVHAIVRNLFSAQPSANHIPGVLLADEVGLGKTFQAGALIAFLSDLAFRQQKNMPLPPIIGKHEFLTSKLKLMPAAVQNPYLGEIKSLPLLPHLIVVPGTILGQWESELRVIFKPGTVDIFVYESGKDAQEKFWDSSSAFSKSLHSANRIVIASHSVRL